jgi:hypothetical protein
MILRMILGRFGVNKNIWIEALIYGIIYFVVSFCAFFIYCIMSYGILLNHYIWYAAAIGAIMSISYLIKVQVFKLLK